MFQIGSSTGKEHEDTNFGAPIYMTQSQFNKTVVMEEDHTARGTTETHWVNQPVDSTKLPTPTPSEGAGDSSDSVEEEDESIEESEDVGGDEDDTIMKEAKAGGPEILSVASTSRLSASIGVPEAEFVNIHKTNPAAALDLLLQSTSQSHSSSEKTDSATYPSNANVNANVKQDSLLNKLKTDYALQNILEALEENPSKAFGYLGFLNKLHNPLTDPLTLCKVIQLENLIDQYVKVVQKEKANVTKLDVQKHAHAALLAKAQEAHLEVVRLRKEAAEVQTPRLVTCKNNIATWEANVAELQRQIDEYQVKIAEEKIAQAAMEAEISQSFQAGIDAKGREGVQAFDDSAIIAVQVQELEDAQQVIETEKISLKALYREVASAL
jgi:hypothetical protein